MIALPNPDISNWSMLDFELAYDGLRQINDATIFLTNQPRAGVDYDLRPGAAFIAGVGDGWCSGVLSSVMESLEARRFDDALDEDRRLRLLLSYQCSWGPSGDPLLVVLSRLAGWQLPTADKPVRAGRSGTA